MGFVMEPVWNGINAIYPLFNTPELVLPIEATNNGGILFPADNAVSPEMVITPVTDTSLPPGFFFNLALGGITIVLLLWSLTGLIRLAYQIILTKKMKHTLVVHEDQHANNILLKAKAHVGVEKDVLLMKGALNSVPMTYGWRQPVIVVPEGIEKEPAVLETVLYHELIHVKRKDYLVGIGTRLVSSIFRFHPLVWLIDRSIQRYRELSCDTELLSTKIITPLNYAQLLLRFNASPATGYTVPMIQKKSVIKHRIKAMSEFTPSPFKMNRVVGWSALLMLLFLPAFFMACNIEAEQLEAPYVAPEGATVIEDLKLAFMLPEGWWQNGEPVRATSADLVEQITPEQLEELKKSDPSMVTGSTDALQTALYMYLYHNLPEDPESMPENPEEELFYHVLTLNVHTYYSGFQLARWSKGKCGRFPAHYCEDRKNSNREFVRVLRPHENPFPEGTGFLYEITNAEIPSFIYAYYFVRDGWAYRISYDISKNALGENPYPPLLDTIGFMD